MDATAPLWAKNGLMIAGVLLSALATFTGLYILWRRRNTEDERERRRRLRVRRKGRLTAGTVLDIEDRPGAAGDLRRMIHYSYHIGSVEYASWQDVTLLTERVGDDPKGVVGSVSVMYEQRNPYNSIVVCEDWTGLRNTPAERHDSVGA